MTHPALQPVLADRHDLAGRNVAHEARADDVKRARLAGEAVARLVRPSDVSAPIASGRTPCGSRKATTRSFVIATIEEAPRRRGS